MAQIKIGSWLYNQIQINGERITTNISFRCCLLAEINPMEVFIRSLPFGMFEDNLIPLMETIGIVAQFRLMMSHSGRNRGFGYVIFAEPSDGYRAILYLNNILLSSWCKLQLSVSKNIRRLLVVNPSSRFDDNDVINLIRDKVDPIKILISERKGQPCYILKFTTHRVAAVSRRLLTAEISDFGPNAWINWDLSDDD